MKARPSPARLPLGCSRLLPPLPPRLQAPLHFYHHLPPLLLRLAALPPSPPQVHDEEDPYWDDGLTRESSLSLATRAAAFADWLAARPEPRVAVVAHSGFLCAMMTAVLAPATQPRHQHAHQEPPAGRQTNILAGAAAGVLAAAAAGAEDQTHAWFGTGEMHTLRLSVRKNN